MLGNVSTHLSLSSFQNLHLDSDRPKGIGRIWICSVINNFCDGEEVLLYKHTLLVKTTDFDIGLHRRLPVGHILKNHIHFKVKKTYFVNKEKYHMTITHLEM